MWATTDTEERVKQFSLGKAQRKLLFIWTQNHKEMFTLMYHVIMGDDPDLKTGKPSPNIFLACCYEEV
uniref:Uncharacterized protein n=1 Tax=Oryza punctata TaxID=4537 RepID=A0A0E0LBM9_ORYPU